MIDVAVLRKIRRNLERIPTRNPQRVEIEPFRFSFAYDGDTFCYCPSQSLVIQVDILTTQEWQLYQFPLLVSIVWGKILMQSQRR